MRTFTRSRRLFVLFIKHIACIEWLGIQRADSKFPVLWRFRKLVRRFNEKHWNEFDWNYLVEFDWRIKCTGDSANFFRCSHCSHGQCSMFWFFSVCFSSMFPTLAAKLMSELFLCFNFGSFSDQICLHAQIFQCLFGLRVSMPYGFNAIENNFSSFNDSSRLNSTEFNSFRLKSWNNNVGRPNWPFVLHKMWKKSDKVLVYI